MMEGFLNIDKPAGMTSHDVVAKVRQIISTSPVAPPTVETMGDGRKRPKVGHAGTLDPFATGVLIVGIGRGATKQLDEFHQFDKEYETTVTLGATSDTDDLTGKIKPTPRPSLVREGTVEEVIKKFIGDIKQIPPAYAAIKQGGEKMYEKARRGEKIILGPRDVTIHEIEMLGLNYPELKLRVVCSTGTYVRALARDIGQELGVGGYCSQLTRTRIGPYRLDNALKLESLNGSNIEPSLLPIDLLTNSSNTLSHATE